ncbi:hypothetical protein [Methylovorus glucosotrophus]|uniref:Uncharacterized protein n=1 Tax=Methylovorus glucosotrophus (strain SIP3-4) TaxID=582744 RepID=C6XEU9_METGS|nr:hypothetical protein [Methylovorus glucosotrophus]ACT52156.1 hypothetical protein Msip34_2840 [Methylovorus glucosotrophus SIP3-4]
MKAFNRIASIHLSRSQVNAMALIMGLLLGGFLTFIWGMTDAYAAECLTDIGAGQYQIASPQPTEISECVYLIAQPKELTAGAWSLTVEQGQQLAAAIALLWAIGAVFRVLISLLKQKESQHEES